MKTFKILLLILISCCFTTCDKSNIEQLKIDFTSGTGIQFGTGSVQGRTFETEMLYKNFNKKHYRDCKSIIFVANLICSSGKKGYLELYDNTDSVIIANSILTANSTYWTWKESENLINDFPDKDIDLTLKLRSESESYTVSFNSASLYINF